MKDSNPSTRTLGPVPSILPWSIGAWIRDIQITGFAGLALLSLQIAEFGRFKPGLVHHAHEGLGSLLVFRVPFTLAAFILLIASLQFRKVRLRIFSGWFLLYAIYFLVSSIWSTAPVMTFGKGTELLIGLGIVLFVSCAEDPLYRLDALRTLLLRAIATVGSVAVVGYLLRIPAFVSQRPGIFLTSNADTPFLSSNGLGYISSLLLLCVIADYLSGRNHGQRVFMESGYALFLFLFAASRTSLLIIVVGIGLLFIRKSRILGASYFILIVVGIYLNLDRVINVIQEHQSQRNFDTLSGRTVVWAAAWRQWETNPFLGFGGEGGYGSGWRCIERRFFLRQSFLKTWGMCDRSRRLK